MPAVWGRILRDCDVENSQLPYLRSDTAACSAEKNLGAVRWVEILRAFVLRRILRAALLRWF